VPTYCSSACGMEFGGWFAGALYDHFGFYARLRGSARCSPVNLALNRVPRAAPEARPAGYRRAFA